MSSPAQAPTGPQAVTAHPFPRRFVTPLLLGSALNPVNSSVIATALVPIARGVHVPVGQTAALISALYLASAIAQPTGGKLAEEFGPRRVFLAGIAIVLAGGVLGGLAPNLTTLILARVLIGVGTSGAYPTAMLMINRRATAAGLDRPPGGVLGALQIAGTVTAAIGTPLGGVLVQLFGWRAAFWINVPVAVVALLMALGWLPADPPAAGPRTAREVATRIDLIGIAAFAATMAALLLFLDGLPAADWAVLAVAVVLAVALVAWELRASRPFIDVRLLARRPALSRTYLRFALVALVAYTVLYGLTQWAEAGHGLSALDAGLLLPMSGLSALLSQPISRRNLIRGPLLGAAISGGVGAVGVLLLTSATPVAWIAVVTLVFGVTLATFAVGNQTALYTQADGDQIATAAGLLRTFGYLGSIGSSALISVFFRTGASDHGLHTLAAIMIGVSLVALVFTLADRQLPGRAGR
jgi:MFS family permease